MVCQHDGRNIGKDANGRNDAVERMISVSKMSTVTRIVLRSSDISIYCLLTRSVSVVRGICAQRESPEGISAKSGLSLMESQRDIIYFILETSLLRRSASNAANVDHPRMHFSRCSRRREEYFEESAR